MKKNLQLKSKQGKSEHQYKIYASEDIELVTKLSSLKRGGYYENKTSDLYLNRNIGGVSPYSTVTRERYLKRKMQIQYIWNN